MWIRMGCLELSIFKAHWKILYFFAPFFGALFGILLERPSRRRQPTIYVMSQAIETLWRMAASRGLVKPQRHGLGKIFRVFRVSRVA
jgi:hypothetical protein